MAMRLYFFICEICIIYGSCFLLHYCSTTLLLCSLRQHQLRQHHLPLRLQRVELSRQLLQFFIRQRRTQRVYFFARIR